MNQDQMVTVWWLPVDATAAVDDPAAAGADEAPAAAGADEAPAAAGADELAPEADELEAALVDFPLLTQPVKLRATAAVTIANPNRFIRPP
ncbi:MAG TPA: hypothetical protein VIJ96_06665 [Acidothermaceae bacterium]